MSTSPPACSAASRSRRTTRAFSTTSSSSPSSLSSSGAASCCRGSPSSRRRPRESAVSPHPDAWLFLPPEVEALVPQLLARLAAPGEDSPDEVERDLRYRIETLILEGDADQWRTFLPEATEMVAES